MPRKGIVQRAAAILLVACVFLALTVPALAEPGVTVGIGAITMHEPLRAGGHYPLPAVPVTNSGTVASNYRVVINTIEGQKELKPDPAWFFIRPQGFSLKPGEQQDVIVTVELPWWMEPGSYFCLIQVGPVIDVQGTGLGVAAAAKLSFTVNHGNIVVATAYTIVEALQVRAPWSYLILTALAIVVGYPILGRVFGIKIAIERRK